MPLQKMLPKRQVTSCQLSFILDVEARTLQLRERRDLWERRVQELSELDERSS